MVNSRTYLAHFGLVFFIVIIGDNVDRGDTGMTGVVGTATK